MRQNTWPEGSTASRYVRSELPRTHGCGLLVFPRLHLIPFAYSILTELVHDARMTLQNRQDITYTFICSSTLAFGRVDFTVLPVVSARGAFKGVICYPAERESEKDSSKIEGLP